MSEGIAFQILIPSNFRASKENMRRANAVAGFAGPELAGSLQQEQKECRMQGMTLMAIPHQRKVAFTINATFHNDASDFQLRTGYKVLTDAVRRVVDAFNPAN